MTEPDEALLWAMKQPASLALPVIRMARAYRAGQAASAARIKALEEALRPLDECAIIGSDSGSRRAWNPDDHGARYFITYREIRRARALLKEADQ